eukprot:scaffold178690_cov53-Attheya_sp.AAC.1
MNWLRAVPHESWRKSKSSVQNCFSDQSDRILVHGEKEFDCYFYIASTARMLFNWATLTGRIPVEGYYHIQASRNCHIVAVCVCVVDHQASARLSELEATPDRRWLHQMASCHRYTRGAGVACDQGQEQQCP